MLIERSGASRLAGFILFCVLIYADNTAFVCGQTGFPPGGNNQDAWSATRNKFATIEVDASGGISASKSSPAAHDYYKAQTHSRRLPVESTEGTEIESIIAISLVVVVVVGIGLFIRSRLQDPAELDDVNFDFVDNDDSPLANKRRVSVIKAAAPPEPETANKEPPEITEGKKKAAKTSASSKSSAAAPVAVATGVRNVVPARGEPTDTATASRSSRALSNSVDPAVPFRNTKGLERSTNEVEVDPMASSSRTAGDGSDEIKQTYPSNSFSEVASTKPKQVSQASLTVVGADSKASTRNSTAAPMSSYSPLAAESVSSRGEVAGAKNSAVALAQPSSASDAVGAASAKETAKGSVAPNKPQPPSRDRLLHSTTSKPPIRPTSLAGPSISVPGVPASRGPPTEVVKEPMESSDHPKPASIETDVAKPRDIAHRSITSGPNPSPANALGSVNMEPLGAPSRGESSPASMPSIHSTDTDLTHETAQLKPLDDEDRFYLPSSSSSLRARGLKPASSKFGSVSSGASPSASQLPVPKKATDSLFGLSKAFETTTGVAKTSGTDVSKLGGGAPLNKDLSFTRNVAIDAGIARDTSATRSGRRVVEIVTTSSDLIAEAAALPSRRLRVRGNAGASHSVVHSSSSHSSMATSAVASSAHSFRSGLDAALKSTTGPLESTAAATNSLKVPAGTPPIPAANLPAVAKTPASLTGPKDIFNVPTSTSSKSEGVAAKSDAKDAVPGTSITKERREKTDKAEGLPSEAPPADSVKPSSDVGAPKQVVDVRSVAGETLNIRTNDAVISSSSSKSSAASVLSKAPIDAPGRKEPVEFKMSSRDVVMASKADAFQSTTTTPSTATVARVDDIKGQGRSIGRSTPESPASLMEALKRAKEDAERAMAANDRASSKSEGIVRSSGSSTDSETVAESGPSLSQVGVGKLQYADGVQRASADVSSLPPPPPSSSTKSLATDLDTSSSGRPNVDLSDVEDGKLRRAIMLAQEHTQIELRLEKLPQHQREAARARMEAEMMRRLEGAEVGDDDDVDMISPDSVRPPGIRDSVQNVKKKLALSKVANMFKKS